MGYARAGFEVVGVDIKPQPHYPFEFFQDDALRALDFHGNPNQRYGWWKFDAIHASPPCQAYTSMSNRWRGQGGQADQHPDLIAPTRALLEASRLPWVMENVPGAKRLLRSPVTLTGGMFGLGVHRPRLFELSWFVLASQPVPTPGSIGVYGKSPDGRLLWARADGSEQRAARGVAEALVAMGIDWMEWAELKEAIPPAYTEWIGLQLMAHLKERAA